MHGYELNKLLEARDVADWAAVSRPQVYYSLRKLADGGHLRSVESAETALGPERVVYKPTVKAAKSLKKALAEPEWMEQRPPSPFVTWVSLALLAPAETVTQQLDRRMRFLEKEIDREEETLRALLSEDGRDAAVARALIEFAIVQFRAEAATINALREAFAQSRC